MAFTALLTIRKESALQSRIARVIIAGNILPQMVIWNAIVRNLIFFFAEHGRAVDRPNAAPYEGSRCRAGAAMQRVSFAFDAWFKRSFQLHASSTSSSRHLSFSFRSAYALQPLNKALMPLSSRYDTLLRETNPFSANIAGCKYARLRLRLRLRLC